MNEHHAEASLMDAGYQPYEVPRIADVQRDMELVRELFRTIIAKNDLVARRITLPDRDEGIVGRHIEMLYAAGYIDGIAAPKGVSDNYQEIFVIDLSWQGHEFAGALLTDEGTWQKVKEVFGPDRLATLPLKLIERVATDAVEVWLRAKVGL